MVLQSTKRGDLMSDREKEIINKLKKAIPNMTDFDKGYILGKTEKLSENSLKEIKEVKENG